MAIDKQALIEKIQNLDGLANEDKSALIGLLREHKKYGLVWENKSEDAEELLQTKIPVITEDKEKAVISQQKDSPNHLIIEGDNLHALTILSYTHSGCFDVIYIDPPYNTGAKNWKYNNDYVDDQDCFRHSKWISFMAKRLKIAKKLLSRTGIIVATIDDYEIENLTLLMNEIFGENNHLGTVVIKNNPQGRSSVTGFQISHEYGLFYGGPDAAIGRLPRNEEQLARYGERDEYGPFEWRNFRAQYSTESPKMVYPIFVKKDCSDFRIPQMSWNESTQDYDLHEDPREDEVITLPIDETGRKRTWKWSIATVLESKDRDMGARLDRAGRPTVYYKGRMKSERMLPYTFWDKPEYSASTFGANLLAEIIGKKKFDYPKSLYAVIDSIQVASEKKDALILDFFAGSGTTLHATMQLNKDDGGHRCCVLATNDENNICEDVTYERNRRVILGYSDSRGHEVEGLTSNNLRYYRVSFVGRASTNQNKRKLMLASTDLLCVKNGIYQECPTLCNKKLNSKAARYFDDNGKRMLIIYDERAVLPIVDILRSDSDERSIMIYLFSNSRYAYEDEFTEISGKVTLCALPAAIYDAYKKVLKPVSNDNEGTQSLVDGYPVEKPFDETLY